jgi:Alpha/beta hydrolase domain
MKLCSSFLMVLFSFLLSFGSPASADCVLAPFRDRINATLASLVIGEIVEEGIVETRKGQPYKRFRVPFSGTLDGCVTKEGPLAGRLYDAPDMALLNEALSDPELDLREPFPLPLAPGQGNTSERFYATGQFRAQDGAAMTFFQPTGATPWNGKIFIVQHGSGVYPQLGELTFRSQQDLFTPGLGDNNYLEVMIDKGYVVVFHSRDGSRTGGISTVMLEDGTVLRTTFQDYATQILVVAEIAQNFVESQLGKRPSRTYYYGKSAGGISGRLANYAPGANVSTDGGRIIDGFLIDDSGGGRPLPVMFMAEQDVLFDEESEREAFAPQIDIAHQLYFPASYLQAKRENARLLLQKGLGNKHREYEIRGVSHFDAGNAGTVGTFDNLDIGGIIDALVDALDNWVDKGIAPTPSKEDVRGSEPAVALPEVACPLGVYYAEPADAENDRQAAQTTGFAAFDGTSLEPLDFFGNFVDMNGNGIRDTRETVSDAWRRLGLLKSDRKFRRSDYTSCVAQAAKKLVKEGLLPPRVAAWYQKEADTFLNETGASW